jgi:transcription termination/antitermination protein NusA
MAHLNQVVRTEFAAAIAQIATERKIEEKAIFEAIKHALVSAYRKELGSLDDDYYYFVELDQETGAAAIFQCPVTERDEETEEILAWDDSKAEKVTPPDFGRIAAQTAKQVILQEIRRSEKEQIVSDYKDRLGEIITGQVLRMDRGSVVVEIGRGQGLMPPQEQMRGEFYRTNQRIVVLIKEISDEYRGATIIVSRSAPELVEQLFAREVPEVSSGAVEIVATAREAGVRTKIAVNSTQEGVDPVGSCVGQRGVRVQKVIEALNNEKIDIVPFHEDIVLYLKAALAPAENLLVEVDEEVRTVVVTAPDDQLSLAIGRGGQNVRLAAKLTGYHITIQSAAGSVESQVTGEEDYEIDTWEELEEETREFLVQNKLTTLHDLDRFQNKWVENDKITTEQKEFIETKVKKFQEEQAEREAERVELK